MQLKTKEQVHTWFGFFLLALTTIKDILLFFSKSPPIG